MIWYIDIFCIHLTNFYFYSECNRLILNLQGCKTFMDMYGHKKYLFDEKSQKKLNNSYKLYLSWHPADMENTKNNR